MAQFDVFENTNKTTKTLYPYLLDIQSDLLSELNTTVVVPMTSPGKNKETYLSVLHPVCRISGKKYVVVTTLLAGIERKLLQKKVTSMEKSRDDIIAAVDLLITGI